MEDTFIPKFLIFFAHEKSLVLCDCGETSAAQKICFYFSKFTEKFKFFLKLFDFFHFIS